MVNIEDYIILKIGDCSIEILIKFILLIDAAAAGDNDDD
jgi:hypothetical protein